MTAKGIGGRPAVITAKVTEDFCALLRVGNFRQAAAKALGIGDRTVQRWFAAGRRDAEAGRQKTPAAAFWRAVSRAEGDAELGFVAQVKRAALGYDEVTTVETRKAQTNSRGEVLKGEDGEPLVEVTTKTISRPTFHPDLAKFWLERKARERWGRHDRIDLGTPAPTADPADQSAELERLAAVLVDRFPHLRNGRPQKGGGSGRKGPGILTDVLED